MNTVIASFHRSSKSSLLIARATLLVSLLLAALLTSSQSAGDDKIVTHRNAKAEQPQSQPTLDTSSLEKAIRESIREASEKPDPKATEKADTDRKLAEYTGQLSSYTFWLVVATGVLAVIAVYQGVQLQRAVALGNREFIASHRPRVVLRAIRCSHHQVAFELPPYEPPDTPIECIFVNVGGTPARIVKFEGLLQKRPNKLFPPVGSQGQNQVVFSNRELKNGQSMVQQVVSTITSAELEAMAGVPICYAVGSITYIDDNDVSRTTAFCRDYDPYGKCFRRYDEAQYLGYEYED